MFDAGEMRREDILAEIHKTPAYYTAVASRDWIVTRYRQASAAAAKTAHVIEERAHAIGELATDLMIEQITPAQFDYALSVWRKKTKNEFLPLKSGWFLETLREAGFAGPTKGQGERHVARLRALIDPQYTDKPKASYRGIKTAPPEKEAGETDAERAAFLETFLANRPLRDFPKEKRTDHTAAERKRDLGLIKLIGSPRIILTEQGGSKFHTIVVGSIPVRSFITPKEARDFIAEASQ